MITNGLKLFREVSDLPFCISVYVVNFKTCKVKAIVLLHLCVYMLSVEFRRQWHNQKFASAVPQGHILRVYKSRWAGFSQFSWQL